MKKITISESQKISDFSQESSLALPAYVLEKDMHVCDAMKVIAAMPANPYFRLVFCGGTCLSKAYGILERMSEDIDYKVVPTDEALRLNPSARRTKLRAFADSVVAALVLGGFTGKEAVTRKSRDAGAANAINATYDSSYAKPESLRPELLIEMNYTNLVKPTQHKQVGLLLDRLTIKGYATPFSLECVSLEEALAEKLISFPRRLGKQMADQLEEGDKGPKIFDDKFLEESLDWSISLVRHIFDVKILLEKHPELLSDIDGFGELLAIVIKKDALDFKNKHADFIEDPVSELHSAIVFAKSSKKLRSQYETFVADMVYGDAKPSYDIAVTHFEAVLDAVLNTPSLKNAIATRPVVPHAPAPRQSQGGPSR